MLTKLHEKSHSDLCIKTLVLIWPAHLMYQTNDVQKRCLGNLDSSLDFVTQPLTAFIFASNSGQHSTTWLPTDNIMRRKVHLIGQPMSVKSESCLSRSYIRRWVFEVSQTEFGPSYLFLEQLRFSSSVNVSLLALALKPRWLFSPKDDENDSSFK